MKILAFGASSSRRSINHQLARHAADIVREELVTDAQSEEFNLSRLVLSLYSEDLEREQGAPDAARDFLEAIGRADALIISFAEHNGSYTAAFKNLFDWASRIERKVYQGKPAVFLSTSPGARGAASVLETALSSAPFFGALVRASVSIGSFHESFDVETGRLVEADAAARLRTALATLVDS
ncbi:MAG: NAD(P)H-dependent oxidoreductase [Acidobacteriota bacterium]